MTAYDLEYQQAEIATCIQIASMMIAAACAVLLIAF
jgi:hypothetical protein